MSALHSQKKISKILKKYTKKNKSPLPFCPPFIVNPINFLYIVCINVLVHQTHPAPPRSKESQRCHRPIQTLKTKEDRDEKVQCTTFIIILQFSGLDGTSHSSRVVLRSQEYHYYKKKSKLFP